MLNGSKRISLPVMELTLKLLLKTWALIPRVHGFECSFAKIGNSEGTRLQKSIESNCAYLIIENEARSSVQISSHSDSDQKFRMVLQTTPNRAGFGKTLETIVPRYSQQWRKGHILI
ncbi:hypothetical protein F4777DRAFT_542860 [Nemania sp. FL0916]|nr:hypothetical protein F4777DRAFT_542860 [Nemania sp. FL0916]